MSKWNNTPDSYEDVSGSSLNGGGQSNYTPLKTPFTNRRTSALNIKSNPTLCFEIYEYFSMGERTKDGYEDSKDFEIAKQMQEDQIKRFKAQYERFSKFLQASQTLKSKGKVEIDGELVTTMGELMELTLKKQERSLVADDGDTSAINKQIRHYEYVMGSRQSNPNVYARIFKGYRKATYNPEKPNYVNSRGFSGKIVNAYQYIDNIKSKGQVNPTEKLVLHLFSPEFKDGYDMLNLESTFTLTTRLFIDLLLSVDDFNNILEFGFAVRQRPKQDENGKNLTDENGNLIYAPYINNKTGEYSFNPYIKVFNEKGDFVEQVWPKFGNRLNKVVKNYNPNPEMEIDQDVVDSLMESYQGQMQSNAEKAVENGYSPDLESAMEIQRSNMQKKLEEQYRNVVYPILEAGYTLEDSMYYIRYTAIRSSQNETAEKLKSGEMNQKEGEVIRKSNDAKMVQLFSELIEGQLKPKVQETVKEQYDEFFDVSYITDDRGKTRLKFNEKGGEVQESGSDDSIVDEPIDDGNPKDEDGDDLPF